MFCPGTRRRPQGLRRETGNGTPLDEMDFTTQHGARNSLKRSLRTPGAGRRAIRGPDQRSLMVRQITLMHRYKAYSLRIPDKIYNSLASLRVYCALA